MATAPIPADAAGEHPATLTAPPVPTWFQRGLVVAIAAIISWGGIGLFLAVIGHYRLDAVAIAGSIATVVLAALAWPRTETTAAGGPQVQLPAIGMAVVAVGSVIWNAVHAGQHVVVDRDPGVYASAGKWIAEHGTLVVNAGKPWAGILPVDYGSAGMYTEPAGTVEFQFNHLSPVLYAEANDLFGDRVLFLVPALLGGLALCAVYAVACRLVQRPWLALAAVTGLAVCLPQLFVSRDTYSETSAQLLLWGGLGLLLAAYDRRRAGTALLAGLAVGGALMTRVDALAYLIPLPLLGAVAWLAAIPGADRRSLGRTYAWFALGAAATAALSTVDVVTRAGSYVEHLHGQVTLLRLGFLGSVVAAVAIVLVWPRLAGLRRFATVHRARAATSVAAIAALGLLVMWAIRPAFVIGSGGDFPGVGIDQAREGLPIDATRSYAEHTMVWMSWYLGAVVLAFAIVGVALLIWRFVRRGDAAAGLVLAAAGIGTALYLITPQITPVQIWAMRRYVPAALPFLVICAAVAIDMGLARLPRTTEPAVRRVIAAAIAIALVGFPLSTTWPVRSFSPQAGYLTPVHRLCSVLGPRSAVLFGPGDISNITLPQTLRDYCGAESGGVFTALTTAEIQSVAAKWRQQGRTLWVVGSSPDAMAEVAPDLAAELVATVAANHMLEETVSRPPSAYVTEQLQLYAARVR